MTERQKALTWRRIQAQRNKFTAEMTKVWKDTMEKQIKPVLSEISESTVKDIEGRIPALIQEDLVEGAWTRTIETVGVFFARQTYQDAVKALGPAMVQKAGGMPTNQQWQREVMTTLSVYAGDRITAITDGSRKQAVNIVKRSLSRSQGDGLGISQMTQQLRDDLIEGWGDFTDYRAARIARTETVMASNLGSWTGAMATGEPMEKVWLSTRDSRTRRTSSGGKYKAGKFDHIFADGEKVPMKGFFKLTGEELEYPGDYRGSAANVINCRCTLYFEPTQVDEKPGPVGTPAAPARPPVGVKPPTRRPQATDPWANRETAKQKLAEILGAEEVDLSTMNLQLAKEYGQAVEKLKEAGWPVHVARLIKATGRRRAVAYAMQGVPGRPSTIWYGGWFRMTPEKFKAKVLEQTKAKFWPKVKPGNEMAQVLVHETAHSMVTFQEGVVAGTIDVETATKVQAVYGRYWNKVKDTKWEISQEVQRRMKLVDRDTYRGDYYNLYLDTKAKVTDELTKDWWISEYAVRTIDEFWAESFTMVTLGENPSPFATEVVDLLRGKITDKRPIR